MLDNYNQVNSAIQDAADISRHCSSQFPRSCNSFLSPCCLDSFGRLSVAFSTDAWPLDNANEARGKRSHCFLISKPPVSHFRGCVTISLATERPIGELWQGEHARLLKRNNRSAISQSLSSRKRRQLKDLAYTSAGLPLPSHYGRGSRDHKRPWIPSTLWPCFCSCSVRLGVFASLFQFLFTALSSTTNRFPPQR